VRGRSVEPSRRSRAPRVANPPAPAAPPVHHGNRGRRSSIIRDRGCPPSEIIRSWR
jgi:hypothetical protein